VIGPVSDVRAFSILRTGLHVYCSRDALSINGLDQDPPTQVGNDQENKVLSEMNELQDFVNGNWSREAE
jgi:hypothetical protein